VKRILVLMLTLGFLALSTPSWAESATEESTLGQIGTGVGSVVGSAVYLPFKATFCILGGIGSGFTLLAAGSETANKVIDASCRGTWAITPEIVKGEEPVHFVGEAQASPQSREARAR